MDRMSATECGLYVKKLKNELLSLKGNTWKTIVSNRYWQYGT
jgi:hypothetical protein